MVDVIIPAYNSHDTIEATLFSIAYQDIVDKINVYVVNDNSSKDYVDFVKYFSNFMNIKELKLEENVGPGLARQFGIDNSNSDYIIFIDSDDVLSDCFAIQNLLNEIVRNNSDMVISCFVEERQNGFLPYNNDVVRLHGKIYRRSFLENKKIRFNDSRADEDNGFNQLVMLCDANVTFINKRTYIWCNNVNSITRKDNHSYCVNGIKGYAYNILWALENAIEKKGNIAKISSLSFSCLVALYYYYIELSDKFDFKSILDIIVKIKKIFDKYPLSETEQTAIIQSQLNFSLNTADKKYILNPNVSLKQFLEMIDLEEL